MPCLGDRKIGLNYLRHKYHILEPIIMMSTVVGLPMTRRRCFIVLIRNDLATPYHVTTIYNNIALIKKYPCSRSSIETFLAKIGEDFDSDRTAKKARISKKMTTPSAKQSCAYRKREGLPPLGTRVGSPAMHNPTKYGVACLPLREVDVLDCALLTVKKMGPIPKDLVVDLAASLSRKPWRCDGKVTSFSTNCKPWWNYRLLTPEDCMNMMGWPRDTVKFPENMPDNQRMKLIGNMVATPVIGCLFMAIMREINFYSEGNPVEAPTRVIPAVD